MLYPFQSTNMVTTRNSDAAHTFETTPLPFPWSRQILRRPSGNPTTSRIPRIATRDGSKRRLLYTILCRHCDTILSDAVEEGWCLANREMRANFFSTSLVTDAVQVSGLQKYRTTLCCCDRMDVACRVCGSDVGYIVVQICDECNLSRHNGNRYVIYPATVNAREVVEHAEVSDWNTSDLLPVPER